MESERVEPALGVELTSAMAAAGFLTTLIVATYFIYHDPTLSYFADDDFGALTIGAQFQLGDVLRLGRHFYRPVIALYFAGGYRLFGCAALPFHLTSLTIHLLTVLGLFLFAKTLTGHSHFAATAALFFAVLPGYVEAVSWIAAVTELLSTFWYIATLWLYLRFLQTRCNRFFSAAFVTFAACVLTHESAVTLLPLMVLVQFTTQDREDRFAIGRLAPFAVVLGIFLVVTYIVNSRSYLVSEGHYRFGWHAVLHIVQYIVALYVGKRNLVSYGIVSLVLTVLLLRGTPHVRLYVLWILITLLPVSLFTWDNVSRYLYLPALGFALLLAEATCTIRRRCSGVLWPRATNVITTILVGALTTRFMFFALKESAHFVEHAVPYRRYVSAVTNASPLPPADRIVYLDHETAQLVSEPVRDPAAQVAYCMAPVHIVERAAP
jgi:hypothetical protein